MEAPEFIELKPITVEENGQQLTVSIGDYAKVKLRHLKQFGYTNLKKEDVITSIRRVLNNEKFTDIIDHFIAQDIVIKK